MSTPTVLQAVLSGLEALVDLFDGYRQFYGSDGDPAAEADFLSARFNHGESALFSAHEADVPTGFAQLYPSFSSISLGRIFIVNDIYVAKPWRKRGVGSLLMEAVVEYVSSPGAVRLSLSTAVTNQTAQALY